MTITLSPDIEAALAAEARRQGTTPEAWLLELHRARLLDARRRPLSTLEATDDWEALVLSVGQDRGVSLSHEAVSSNQLYD